MAQERSGTGREPSNSGSSGWASRAVGQWPGVLLAGVILLPTLFSQRAAMKRAATAERRSRAEVAQLRSELIGAEASAGRLRSDLSKTQSDLSSTQSELTRTKAQLASATAPPPTYAAPTQTVLGTYSSGAASSSSQRDDIDRQINLLEARLPAAEREDEENRRWNDQQLASRREAYEAAGRKVRELNNEGKKGQAIALGVTVAALGAAVEASDWKRRTDNADRIRMDMARLKNQRLGLR